PVVYNWSEGVYYGSKTARGDLWKFTGYKHDGVWQQPGAARPEDAVKLHPDDVTWYIDNSKPVAECFYVVTDKGTEKETKHQVTAEAVPPGVWRVLLARIFWVNWFLFLLNLLPGFPLDGGRMLQSVLWWRSDYRQGTLTAIFAGFVVMILMVLVSII